MSEKQNILRDQLNNWTGMESSAEKEEVWNNLIRNLSTEADRKELCDWVCDLLDSLQKKQALIEERQELLNQWQREKEEAMAPSLMNEIEEMQKELGQKEKRMLGYERQFAELQNNARKAQEREKAAVAECDQAWTQFRDREEKLNAANAKLAATEKDRDDAWTQFRDREEKLNTANAKLAAVEKDRDDAWAQFRDRDEKLNVANAKLAVTEKDRDDAWAQFQDREEKLNATSAKLAAVEKDRDDAWTQFRDREEKLDEKRRELQKARDRIETLTQLLTDAKQYGADMAMKVGEMEKLFGVKIHRKLHGG